jgi:PAS domain S-box-containing protein
MQKPKILVVEDERVVAADIEESLHKLGYTVVGAAASGVHAIRRAVETEPDLVLMDIKLKGHMDGIDAAGELHSRLGIPVVFLTAYADGEILQRAKKISPSGYVLKPFDERALRSAVEIALDRHPREKRLAESERRLVTAMRGLEDGVILTNRAGSVTFLNQAAERMTGWKNAEATGKLFSDVFVALHAHTGALLPSIVDRALQDEAAMGLGESSLLIHRFGSESAREGSVVPLADDDHEIVGAAVVFHHAGKNPEYEPLSTTARRRQGDRASLVARLAGNLAENLQQAFEGIDRLLDQLATADNAGPEANQELREQVKQAIRLLNRFSALAQPRIPRPRNVPINRVMEEVEPLLMAVTPGSVSLTNTVKDGTGLVAMDQVQFELAVLELVRLCGQRMPFGGRINLETDTVELLPEFARNHTDLAPGSYAVLSVSQAGSVLIPPAGDAREDCPEVYFQVRDMGGDLQLRSEPGRLTTYEIFLPRVED